MADRTVAELFLGFSRAKLFDQYWPRMRACVDSLTDEQVWWRPNDASNSIGNLLLHLNGNVRQWIVASFERLDDVRDRPAEFAARQIVPRRQLVDDLDATLRRARDVLARLTEEELRATYRIQGYTVSGLEAVYHVVEHFGLHHGQIIYVTKLLQARDLGFYRELSATGRAPESSR